MTHFFSCDWGTSSFRLRGVRAADGQIVAEFADATGIRAMQARYPVGDTTARAAAFAAFLRDRLGAMTAAHPGVFAAKPVVMVSGMASSTVGWRELPYATLPTGLDGANLPREIFPLDLPHGARATVHLFSGLRTESDILRGEETEILGLFAENRYAEIARAGLVILPGTHSKHMRLRNRQITGFHTYLTGELFDVLSAHSLLRASVVAPEATPVPPLTDATAQEAFRAGVQAAIDHGLARSLFQTRTRTVLQSIPPFVNRWFLSGLLIGAEVADISARYPAVPILLAAPESLSLAYTLAFQSLGLEERLTLAPPAEMSLASVRGHLMLLTSKDRKLEAGS